MGILFDLGVKFENSAALKALAEQEKRLAASEAKVSQLNQAFQKFGNESQQATSKLLDTLQKLGDQGEQAGKKAARGFKGFSDSVKGASSGLLSLKGLLAGAAVGGLIAVGRDVLRRGEEKFFLDRRIERQFGGPGNARLSAALQSQTAKAVKETGLPEDEVKKQIADFASYSQLLINRGSTFNGKRLTTGDQVDAARAKALQNLEPIFARVATRFPEQAKDFGEALINAAVAPDQAMKKLRPFLGSSAIIAQQLIQANTKGDISGVAKNLPLELQKRYGIGSGGPRKFLQSTDLLSLVMDTNPDYDQKTLADFRNSPTFKARLLHSKMEDIEGHIGSGFLSSFGGQKQGESFADALGRIIDSGRFDALGKSLGDIASYLPRIAEFLGTFLPKLPEAGNPSPAAKQEQAGIVDKNTGSTPVIAGQNPFFDPTNPNDSPDSWRHRISRYIDPAGEREYEEQYRQARMTPQQRQSEEQAAKTISAALPPISPQFVFNGLGQAEARKILNDNVDHLTNLFRDMLIRQSGNGTAPQ